MIVDYLKSMPGTDAITSAGNYTKIHNELKTSVKEMSDEEINQFLGEHEEAENI